MADDLDAALAWADMTMNARLRDARRTGTDGDYEDKIEWCIDTLAAAVRKLRHDRDAWAAQSGFHQAKMMKAEADLASTRDELAVATSLYHTAKEQLARVSAR